MNSYNRPCPVCGECQDFLQWKLCNISFSEIDDLDLSYVLNACRYCGSVFANGVAPQASYATYYKNFSKYNTSANIREDVAFVHEELKFLLDQYVNKKKKIVDLGCGDGHFLFLLHQIGFSNLLGIEPAPSASRIAKEKYGIDVVVSGDSHSMKIATIKDADVLCMTAVLEHFFDPYGELSLIATPLKRGAFFVLEVPNIAAFSGDRGEPFGEFSLEHINFFSKDSLSLFVARLGFEVIAMREVSYEFSGSLLLLAKKVREPGEKFVVTKTDDASVLRQYIIASNNHIAPLLSRAVDKVRGVRYQIYGAGSHSARLYPMLKRLGADGCVAFLDRNENLIGSTLGGCSILSPEDVDHRLPVLLSSFLSEEFLADSLPSDIETIRFYGA